jgi:Mrp family chromosome partitioning ATPase
LLQKSPVLSCRLSPVIAMKKIVITNLKGGVGKSMFAHHLSARGYEHGLRVLVIDADEQSDVTTRLTGNDAPDPGEPLEFSPGCLVVWVPSYTETLSAEKDFDLVIVDAPKDGLSNFAAVAADASRIYIPVSNVDAAKNSAHVLAAAKEVGVPAVVVFNDLGVGGKYYDGKMTEMESRLPETARISRIKVVHGGAIRRAEETGIPAWEDQWPGRAGETIRQWCDLLLRSLFPDLFREVRP